MPYDLSNPFSLFLFLNAVFAFVLALFVANARSNSSARGVVGVLVGASIWAVADGLRIASTTVGDVLRWNMVTYVGVAFIPPAVVLFVASYTDRRQWLRPRRFGVFVAVSVAMVATVFTNPWHGLWRPEETVNPTAIPPMFSEVLGIVHIAWVAYVLLGVVPMIYFWLLQDLRTAPSALFRRQIAIILVGITGPVVTSALYITRVTPIDLTPFGFTAFGLALTVAITQYRALDIGPIGRDAVVETMEHGAVVLDDDKRVVDVNSSAIDIIGVDRDGIIGATATTDVPELKTVVDGLETDADGRETVTVDVDGGTRHYHADFSAVRDDRGTHLGFVVILSDVTDRVARQQQLERRADRLAAKNEQLDQFASVLSHDIRNPLNVAQLRIEQVRTEHDDGDVVETAAAAADALDRIERMTDQLLALSRIETDVDTPEPVLLRSVVDRAWEAVAVDGASLTVEGELGRVAGDRDLVVGLFENLLSNAIDHNDGPVLITVGPLPDAGREGFFVEDDGSGIAAAEPEEVFEYGYSTAEGGTGFGLSIVADIVDAHDWQVDVCEGSEGGARFEITTARVRREE
jgi:PAS domain S-box-containing protein